MKLQPLLATLILAASSLQAVETTAQRDARMAWWREARFGMFVHWGLYSALAGNWDGKALGDHGQMEWIQNHLGLDTQTYAQAALPLFKPKADFAREWARLAKEAGCRYIVITSKHHDGFALHNSRLSEFDAFDATRRDILKEIVDAARAEGLKIGLYHSLIDWHHDSYDYRSAHPLPFPEHGKSDVPRDHTQYLEFLHGQVDELISNYGPLDILWWDYSANEFQGDRAWRAQELMAKVRAKHPGIIMNDRLYRIAEPRVTDGQISNLIDPQYGDFITPEQRIPPTGLPGVDWETCMTLNTTWGYNEHDSHWKSNKTLIRNLVDIASKGGNYLLNIGPTADGSVPTPSIEAFQAIGRWMKVHGESIYGTTASPIASLAFDGRLTRKGDVLYAHVFEHPPNGIISVPGIFATATLLANGAKLETRSTDGSTEVILPTELPDPDASVIRLQP